MNAMISSAVMPRAKRAPNPPRSPITTSSRCARTLRSYNGSPSTIKSPFTMPRTKLSRLSKYRSSAAAASLDASATRRCSGKYTVPFMSATESARTIASADSACMELLLRQPQALHEPRSNRLRRRFGLGP